MKVIIKTTGKSESLSMIDSDNGVDWIADFIGNNAGFENEDFVLDEERDVYVCRDQETFKWWDEVIDAREALEKRIAALKTKYPPGEIDEAVAECGWVDTEDFAGTVGTALDERFPTVQSWLKIRGYDVATIGGLAPECDEPMRKIGEIPDAVASAAVYAIDDGACDYLIDGCNTFVVEYGDNAEVDALIEADES